MQSGIEKETVIRPEGSVAEYWRDLWAYRELFYFLAWRDVLVRYKQAVLGILWCLLKPTLTVLVFTLVFGRLAQLPSGGVPYPILVFAALLPWQFFSSALTECSASLVSNANLLTKVFFPRLIIPASSVVAALVDFLISFAVMLGVMLYYGVNPGGRLLLLPLFVGIVFVASLGAGLLFAALNVRYRDFRHIVPFVTQFGLFVSPVGFSSEIVPQQWRLLYSLNPMVAAIDGFRWALTGRSTLYLPGLYLSITATLVLLAAGILYFRRTEASFADEI